jgi:NAD+ synthase (glutamine-hydrolysing)
VTFENVQAGLRTDYLFRLANQRRWLRRRHRRPVRAALGWCTYGVGDHMSHYAVNAGVPKTLIQFLIRWAVQTASSTPRPIAILTAILGTEISPELVPADASARSRAPNRIGPYELHDFFLHYVVRHGLAPVEDRVPRLACLEGCGCGPMADRFPGR